MLKSWNIGILSRVGHSHNSTIPSFHYSPGHPILPNFGFVLHFLPSTARTAQKLALFRTLGYLPPAPFCLLPECGFVCTVGDLRVEGVSPSDRGQDARDTIGFVFANQVLSTWRGRPALVLPRRLALFFTPVPLTLLS